MEHFPPPRQPVLILMKTWSQKVSAGLTDWMGHFDWGGHPNDILGWASISQSLSISLMMQKRYSFVWGKSLRNSLNLQGSACFWNPAQTGVNIIYVCRLWAYFSHSYCEYLHLVWVKILIQQYLIIASTLLAGGWGGGVKGGYYLTETLLKYKIYDNTHKLRYFDVAYNDTIGVDKWSSTCMFILFLTNFSTHNTFFYKSPLCI